MEQEKLQDTIKNKIQYIVNYRSSIGKPIDINWLMQASPKVIYGMYYQILNTINKKNTIPEYAQVAIEDLEIFDADDDILFNELSDPNNYEIISPKYPPIYDENGRLRSDGRRGEEMLENEMRKTYARRYK